MRDIIIRPSDYLDLQETLSEKNIINTVYGKEYVVNLAEKSLLVEFDINPETASKVVKKYLNLSGMSNIWKPLNVPNMLTKSDKLNILLAADHYARTETLAHSGSKKFTIDITTESFDWTKPLTCEFQINYTKSKVYRLNEENYNSTNQTSFFDGVTNFPQLENEYDNNIFLDKGQYLPTGKGEAYYGYSSITGSYSKYIQVDMANIDEFCEARFLSHSTDSAEIEVSYSFRTWSAWNSDGGSRYDGNALYINSIHVSVYGTKIETSNIDFRYPLTRKSNERGYELETNELFQTKLEIPEEDRLSYRTYKTITDNYSVDRRIITFDLLNPVKWKIDDNVKFESGPISSRYLDSDDEFTIYDEHNRYMGDFKVIQCNPIWDGAYHKIITAILLDNNETN